MDLLRSPAYAVPLVVNLTGSVWFFLLIGKAGEFGEGSFSGGFLFWGGGEEEEEPGGGGLEWAVGEGWWWGYLKDALLTASFSLFAELSLTVPITNSLAFLFTVLGEWWAEGKVISRGTFILQRRARCYAGVE